MGGLQAQHNSICSDVLAAGSALGTHLLKQLPATLARV
jgi:hypothetical protein